MSTLSCQEMTSDLVRGWLDDRLEAARAADVKRHLRECPSCLKTLTGMTSKNLFASLTGEDSARVASFKQQVATTLASPVTSPLSERLLRLFAATRELLWEPFVAAPIPALGVLSGASGVKVREVDAAGAPVGGVVMLSSPEHFQLPPVLTRDGRFRFVVRGTGAGWVGKQLHCEIKLVEEQTASFDAPIRATSGTGGWEAAFDEQVLTDQSTLAQNDYRIPFDYVKLIVRPSTV